MSRRFECVGQAQEHLEGQRHVLGRVPDETRDGLRNDAPLLRPRATLNQHFKVQLLGREPFKRVLADGAELLLFNIAEQPLLEVRVAEPPSVVIAQDALDVRRGKNFADHVEYGIIVERITDLLELFEEPLKDAAFDGVCGHEIEDQAILALAVTMDATHALFKAIRVPGDIVVEEDIAALGG